MQYDTTIEPQKNRGDLLQKLLTASACRYLETRPLVWRLQGNVLWLALAHRSAEQGASHESRQIVCYELGPTPDGWQVIGAWAENDEPPHVDCPEAVLRAVPPTNTVWRHRVRRANRETLDAATRRAQITPVHAAL